jgi:hypothetical protein
VEATAVSQSADESGARTPDPARAPGPSPQAKPTPLVSFYRLIPDARSAQRADRSAGGTLPTRAFRHCEPATAASGYGWYVFPPIDFSLMWDGTDIVWTHEGADDWYPLSVAQFPGFSDYFDEHAPEDVKSFAPPFIGAAPNPGIVQLWTGLIARSAPGWSLLVRPPANLPRRSGYELYEGIIETDHWFGPLITNLRLTKTDQPIEIRKDYPLVQIQPVPRIAYANETLASFENLDTIDCFSDEDWQRYRETVVYPNIDPDRRRGKYAAAARKSERRGCPVAHIAGGNASDSPAD